jgi:hypothetical protein
VKDKINVLPTNSKNKNIRDLLRGEKMHLRWTTNLAGMFQLATCLASMANEHMAGKVELS